MRKQMILILIIGLLMLATIGCSSSNNAKGTPFVNVTIAEMASFSTTKENTLLTITDEKEIAILKEASDSATMIEGIFDRADPEYKVELDANSYFLWVAEDSIVLMYTDNDVVYKVSEKLVKQVNEIIENYHINVKLLSKLPTEMPKDFDFVVKYGIGMKNEINTIKNTVTKDLIANGTVSANITLYPADMQRIYEKMKEINIMETKQLSSNQSCALIPYSEDIFEVIILGKTIQHAWTSKSCHLTEDAKQLLELRTFIENIVKDYEAYNKLPEAVGGYE
ncbi:hypothetical protein I6N90_00020 [Paenibacillus sp. GSMTC-2017]|uniref:hypothetical protein n=1 Tax=Paenibacillus sp. GSMTC-2017 TaxID=2794350 RepID=UPI0018D8EEB8|nr:hypothetical protein [Paenibacillus sp. GSMTC-2017]MBH5316192.1 hypothetical protein [Paenibacillus sp. GSMTC-2017]